MPITDKFNQATTTGRPAPAALTAIKTIGATSITVDSTAEWPTDTAVHFIIYEVDANNDKIAGTQCDFKGVVNSATTINNLTLRAGTDREYPIGSKVICAPTAAWADDVVEGIVVSLDQDGTLKAGAVDNAAVLASDVVTTDKILDANVTTAKLADASVTPTKRSGGFFIGTIPGATLGTTGNKAITGVGFTPKLVKFYVLPTTNTTTLVLGIGAMTSASQYCVAISDQSTPSRNHSTSACIGWMSAGGTTFTMLSSYVSMDADGFTINVSAASSVFAVAYEAYA